MNGGPFEVKVEIGVFLYNYCYSGSKPPSLAIEAF